MKDLTGASSLFPDQRAFDTGDELNEANLDDAFQAAADRAEYLKVQVDALKVGIKTVRKVTSSANLKALTGMAADEVAIITSVGVFGFYKFVATAPAGTDIPILRYDANDSSGYWINVLYPFVTLGGFSGSVAQLNQSALAVPNRVLANDFKAITTASIPMTFDGSGNFDTALVSNNLTGLQEGDEVTVHFSSKAFAPATAAGAGLLLMYSTNAGSSYTANTSSRSDVVIDPLPATDRRVPISMMARYNVGAGITQVQFLVRGVGVVADTAILYGPHRFHVLATRP